MKALLATCLLAVAALAQTADSPPGIDDLDDVVFAPGSSEVVTAQPTLLRIAAVLSRYRDAKIGVRGHADRSESDDTAELQRLSLARAEAVRAFLTRAGAAAEQVQVSAAGAAEPRVAAATAEASLANRRVSLTLYDPSGRRASASDLFMALGAKASARPPTTSLPPEPAVPKIRETGRAFLKSGERESTEYGLYTYLLIPTPAHPEDAQTKKRHLSAIAAFLLRQEIEALEKRLLAYEGKVDRRQLNIFYLPLRNLPASSTPEAVYDQYDFHLAAYLLSRLPVPASAAADFQRAGPHLISCLRPLSTGGSSAFMHQTLAGVPSGPLIDAWLRNFIGKAQEPQKWDETTLRDLTLQLHTWIETLASEGAETRRGLLASILFFKDGVSQALK